MSIPALKASLHRGRARLRTLARQPEERASPVLAEPERFRLANYVARFNARDFDALRDLLADDVRVDLVARRRFAGKAEVGGTYFGNYARTTDWVFASGFVHSLPAMIASDPRDPGRLPSYFVLLEWSGDQVAAIRDFYHARYAVEGADITLLP
jgi:RNA polymerase sigma-70 factor (ECF subfamily)